MTSYQDTNMCYFNAPTPPSTPIEKITTNKRHRHSIRSAQISKHKISKPKISDNKHKYQSKTLTTLDILLNGQLYSSPENIIETSTDTNKKQKPKPLKPPEIALYTPNTVNKHNINTFNTNDTSTDDIDGESPSSLCVTLYPYETETINEKHFTKTSGTPIDNYPIGCNDQLEGSPSAAYSSPVKIGNLFTDKFPTIEYISKPFTENLSIINDSNNSHNSYNDYQTQNGTHQTNDILTPNYTPTTNDIDTPTTAISSMVSFPEPVRFQRKRVPPPQNQKYNLCNPLRSGNITLPVNWD